MITMAQKQQIIIEVLQRGKSQRSVAREMGVSRNTVKKYIDQYQTAKKRLEEENGKRIETEELIEEIVKPPKYERKNPYKPKMTPVIEKYIDEKLKTNAERRKRGIYKQLMSITEIHSELREKGYDIGYTSVRNYVKKKEDRPKEAYIRQQYEPGELAEFDWGDIQIELGGRMRKVQVAVFALGHSNEIYADLFQKQNTESFLQSHANYMEYLGGTPMQLVYDNMKVAVKSLAGSEKEPTEALLKLSTYYGFDFRFCNVRRGNEKGRVEKGVDVIKKKVFARKMTFATLDEAQTFLKQRLVAINHQKQELFKADRAALGKAMPKMEIGVMRTSKVDKYSTISIDTNHYSVPDRYAQKAVKAKLYPNKIIVYDMKTNQSVTCHNRLYTRGEWQMDINHYLKTFKRKPGAIANSVALDQANKKIKNIYTEYFTKKSKEFIALLHFMDKENISADQVWEAITQLEQHHHREITKDKIQLICQKKTTATIQESCIEEIARKQLKTLSEMMV